MGSGAVLASRWRGLVTFGCAIGQLADELPGAPRSGASSPGAGGSVDRPPRPAMSTPTSPPLFGSA